MKLKNSNYLIKNVDVGILIIRLSVGILMLLHGIGKITHGINFIKGVLRENGLMEFIAYGVYIGEIIAPLCIIIGLRTRLAALILIINMLFALLLVHHGEIFSLAETGGWAIELIALYVLCSLALFYTGAGKYSMSFKNLWD